MKHNRVFWSHRNNMNIQHYLERIGYLGPKSVSIATLKALQFAHLTTVPFENLSIHRNETIRLENEALFQKIVQKRRGGFCYELNGLFSYLLEALGFRVVKISAKVVRERGGFGPEFDHMALLIALEHKLWLLDVGFGKSFREPLELTPFVEQTQEGYVYRMIKEGETFLLQNRSSLLSQSPWENMYSFSKMPYNFENFQEMCVYHQTSPDSTFTRNKVCSRATEYGWITLSETRLIRTVLATGEKTEQKIENDEMYRVTLQEVFGIVLPDR